MPTFKAKIRKRRSNGFHSVYILCIHNRELAYIKTDLVVRDGGVNDKSEVTDPRVLMRATSLICSYYDKLQGKRIDNLTVKEVVNIVTDSVEERISFASFAEAYIRKLSERGVKRADNYRYALNSFLSFAGKPDIAFSEITSKLLRQWVDSLAHTKRAKSMYPTLLKAIFKAGMEEYNDYDRGVLKVANRPFEFLKIPSTETPEKRSVDVEHLRRFFAFSPKSGQARYAQDVALVSFCLAGMNVADLYELIPDNLQLDKVCYHRAKTKGKRSDSAYMEVCIPLQAMEALARLTEGARDGYLLNLSARYYDRHACTSYISQGIKKLCEEAGLPTMTSYSLRHSWATIARNDVGASEEEVAFALNHVSAHRVTDRYIRKDYSRVDRLNDQVIAYVFGEHT
nr:tyrosine-type recombinase/integrase [uncultured Porphyromonas sp.]